MALIDRDQRPVRPCPKFPVFASSARKQTNDVHVFIASRLLRMELNPVKSLDGDIYIYTRCECDDIAELVNTSHKSAHKM